MKKIILITWILLTLPILLHVYEPSLELGGWGILLGFIGITISPLLILITMIWFVSSHWRI